MRFKREDVIESAMLVATLRLPELLAMADTVIHAYAYFTPSQGSANRSASGGVLGAIARPPSANRLIPPLPTQRPHLTKLIRSLVR